MITNQCGAPSALATSLAEIEDSLSPEDMPADGVHPVVESIALADRLKKSTLALQDDFEKLSAKFEESPSGSGVTSVNVSGAAQDPGHLRLLEEKRIELERELADERSAREEEVNELDHQLAKAKAEIDSLRTQRNGANIERASIARELESHSRASRDHASQLSELRRQLDEAATSLRDAAQAKEAASKECDGLRRELAEASEARKRSISESVDLQAEHSKLNKQHSTLLEQLAVKERNLRDLRAEADLDRATLEKELADERERGSVQAKEDRARVQAVGTDNERLKREISGREDELAELQSMCNDRTRSVEKLTAQADATSTNVRKLLDTFGIFFEHYTSSFSSFLTESVPLAPTASTSSPSRSKYVEPINFILPVFQGETVDAAVSSLDLLDNSILEKAREKMTFCASQTKRWQRECKKHRDRAEKAISGAREKIAFRR